MNKVYVSSFLFICFVFILFFSPWNAQFLSDTYTQSISVFQTDREKQLQKVIEEKAKDLNEEAEDAYIDRVWKKTPGRNGRKVNVKKSVERMRKNGVFSESLLVFDEIKPNKTLKDLPAAPIYRGHPKKRMVALIINVSWGTEYVPTILQTLKDAKVKATFFIEGKWATKHKDIVQMIEEQGHIIGSHAYDHPDMRTLSKSEIYEQLVGTNDIIEAITNKRPRYFAPPSGAYTDEVVAIAHSLHMETILWTVDTIDWRNPSVSVMINRVMKQVHPGAIILMHPTAPVAQGLKTLIDEIHQQNLQIGTIEALLNENR